MNHKMVMVFPSPSWLSRVSSYTWLVAESRCLSIVVKRLPRILFVILVHLFYHICIFQSFLDVKIYLVV
jgi:hypothetical protein